MPVLFGERPETMRLRLLQKSQSTENKTITQEMSITHSKGSIPNTKKNRKGKKSRKDRKLANNKNN